MRRMIFEVAQFVQRSLASRKTRKDADTALAVKASFLHEAYGEIIRFVLLILPIGGGQKSSPVASRIEFREKAETTVCRVRSRVLSANCDLRMDEISSTVLRISAEGRYN